MGLSSAEYYALTLREYHLRVEAFNRLQYDMWSRTRLLAYVAAKPYLQNQQLTIWQFFPLAGDPTEEEKLELEKEHFNKTMDYAEQVLNDWKKRNFKV